MTTHGHAAERAPEPVTFLERYQPEVAELFDVLGLPSESAQDLDAAVALTQPWVRGDHFRPGHNHGLSDGQKQQLPDIYARLGLSGEVPLEPGHYDDAVVIGGTQKGNNVRIGFMRDALQNPAVSADHMSLLGGQRKVFPEIETAQIEQTFDVITAQERHDPWVEHLGRNPEALTWETELMRLSAVAHLGGIALNRINLRLENADPIGSYEFTWKDIPVALIHALATERPNGERRHTTESCFQEWLEQESPPEDARVAFICSNPHLYRTAQSSMAVLRDAGRSDITLVPAGPETTQTSNHALYLGEIGRSLYEDQRWLNAG